MRKIVAWFEAGGGLVIANNANFIIKCNNKMDYIEWTSATYSDAEITGGTGQRVLGVYCGSNGIVSRLAGIGASLNRSLNSVTMWGNFEPDNLSITSEGTSIPYTGRLEIRNENGVLITDNGLPWADGTYPPDAKNRAGLADLHAAPAVINPKLDAALMGDETNKERVQE